MTRSATEIISEIQKAASERAREFGRGKHAISEWPITPEEWEIVVEDVGRHALWPCEKVLSANEMILTTQFGEIRLKKGPR